MARLDSMATIDLALSGDTTTAAPGGQSGAGGNTLIPTPTAAPAPAAKKDKAQEKDDKLTSDALADAMAQRSETEEDNRAQDSALAQSAKTTAQAASQIVRYTGGRLASLPLMGGLTFPIVVLLIFFALLLPVGGNTRIQWLWLVLSGNASIGKGSESTGPVTTLPGAPAGGSGSGEGTGPVLTRPGEATASGDTTTTGLSFPFGNLFSFTGVEEVS